MSDLWHTSLSFSSLDMQKFPLRMKDNDLLVTELYHDPGINDAVTALSVYLTPKTSKSTKHMIFRADRLVYPCKGCGFESHPVDLPVDFVHRTRESTEFTLPYTRYIPAKLNLTVWSQSNKKITMFQGFCLSIKFSSRRPTVCAVCHCIRKAFRLNWWGSVSKVGHIYVVIYGLMWKVARGALKCLGSNT